MEKIREVSMRRYALIPALILALLLGCAARSPATPDYDFENLVSDLESAGARVEVTDDIWDSKVFDSETQAQAINIDGVRATVLMYANAAVAESAASRISPDGYGIAGASPGIAQFVDWTDTPHFFKKGRLIVYYVGNEEPVLKVLEGVLGPQFSGG
jgi:hypothetical protein